MNKKQKKYGFNVIFIFFIYLLLSFYPSFSEKNCYKNEKIEICIQECEVNSFCKLLLFFEGKKLYVFPGNSDYILISDSTVKFLKFHAVMFNQSPATLEIIPLKKEFILSNLVLDNVFYNNFSIVIPDEIIQVTEETKNETKIVEKRSNFLDKITEFNKYYLIFVGSFFVILIAYEIVYQRKTSSYGPEIDKLIKQIEKERMMKQQNQNVNNEQTSQNINTISRNISFDEFNFNKSSTSLELSLGINDLKKIIQEENNESNNESNQDLESNRRNIDLSVLRKTILISKMKGIPKESLLNHLKNKYPDVKMLKNLIDEIYR